MIIVFSSVPPMGLSHWSHIERHFYEGITAPLWVFYHSLLQFVFHLLSPDVPGILYILCIHLPWFGAADPTDLVTYLYNPETAETNMKIFSEPNDTRKDIRISDTLLAICIIHYEWQDSAIYILWSRKYTRNMNIMQLGCTQHADKKKKRR